MGRVDLELLGKEKGNKDIRRPPYAETNLPPFDVVVPPGVDPTTMAQQIVDNGGIGERVDLELLSEDSLPKPIVKSTSEVKPKPKTEAVDRNAAVRRYYESEVSNVFPSFTSQLIPGQLGNVEPPEPPGGWSKEGKPLDEKGIPYNINSRIFQAEVGKAIKKGAEIASAYASSLADRLAVKTNVISEDLTKAYRRASEDSPLWIKAAQLAAAVPESLMSLNSGVASTIASRALKYYLMAEGKSDAEAEEMANQAAEATTYEPLTEEGKTLAEIGGKILGFPFEVAQELLQLGSARQILEESLLGDFIEWAGGRRDLIGMPFEEFLTFYLGAKGIGKATAGAKVLRESIYKALEAKNLESSFNYVPSAKPPTSPYTGKDFVLDPDIPVTSGMVVTRPVKDIPQAESKATNEDIVEIAKAKLAEAERIQAELAAKMEKAKATKAEDIVKEELKIKGEKIKEIKNRQSETIEEPVVVSKGEEIVEPTNRVDLELLKEEPKEEVTPVKQPKLPKLTKEEKHELNRAGWPIKEINKMSVEEQRKNLALSRGEGETVEIDNKVTELDEHLGSSRSVDLDTESHPFRDKDVEHTNTMSKLYREQIANAEGSPEVHTRYLINEVNRWLNGEDVNIAKVRDALSELSTRADELRDEFDSGRDHNEWKETVRESAVWARKADRFKSKQSEKRTGDVQLNMMIPVDQLPEMVKDLLRTFKVGIEKAQKMGGEYFFTGEDKNVIPAVSLYRNKEVFDKTGFWLGKDGKWRYEIGDEGLKINLSFIKDDYYLLPLDRVVDHPTLYKAVPELKDINIVLNKNLESEGVYLSNLHRIEIKYANKDIIVHELQHAVNDIVGSKFKGTNVEVEKTKRDKILLEGLRELAKDQNIIAMIDDSIRSYTTLNPFLKNALVNKVITQVKGIEKSSSIDKLIERYRESTAFNDYMKEPGEMEARLVSKRMGMIAEQKKAEPPWETLDKMLEYEGITTNILGDTSIGRTLYMGIDPTQIVKVKNEIVGQIKKMLGPALEAKNASDAAMETKKFNLLYATNQLKIDSTKAFIEQSETLLKKVRKLYPKESQRIIDRQRSAVAGKGYGKIVYDQMIKEVFDGKSDEQVKLRNNYILFRRLNDIYSYKGSGYIHQKGYGPDQTINYTSLIEMIKEMPEPLWQIIELEVPELKKLIGKATPKELTEAIRDGEAFFEWNRKLVDDLVEAGMKSEEEGRLLKAHDFRKFKTLEVEQIYDFSYNTKLRGETIRGTNSGVVSLGQGSAKILDPDARISALEMASRVYGAIANQAAKAEWKNLAEKYPDNGFVSIGSGVPENWRKINVKYAKDEKPIYYNPKVREVEELKNMKGSALYEYFKSHPESEYFVSGTGRTAPSGWSPMPYFEKGVRKNIFFHPDAAQYLVTKSHDISPRASMLARTATMAPVTKALAVGLSPAWSTFLGLPMDVIHSLWTAKVWEADAKGIKGRLTYPFYETTTGKYKKVYSPFLPQAALQIGLDMKRTLTDVYTRGPLYKNLMKHGMSMPFLSLRETKYLKGVKPPGDWAKFLDILSSHGVKMETWVRAAVADRVVRDKARKTEISYEEALKNDDIMYEAVHSARDRMDYNQGGWFVKLLDQNGMIFLNAATLGTRTFWRSAVENPVDFTFRTMQLMTAASGITAAAWSLYPYVMEDIPTEGNEKNAVFPLFPDWLNFEDSNGDIRYFYVKLRMDPGPAFMYKIADNLTRTYMYDRELLGREPNYYKLVNSLKQIGPTSLSLPPSIQMGYDYAVNYSWWKERQMYTDLGGRTLPWPKSRFEGRDDNEVAQLAKDVSGVTGLSAPRLQGSVSNVIPYNNEFVYMFGKGYEELFSDVPEEVRRKPWLQTLAEMPGFNRVIGITAPGYGRRQVSNKINDEIELKNLVINGKFDMLAENFAWKGVGERSEVIDYAREQDFDTENRLRADLDFMEKVRGLKHRSFWLALRRKSLEGKAKTFIKLQDTADEKELDQLDEERNYIVGRGGLGIFTPEFNAKIIKLRSGGE